ncbi:N-acetyl-gamma-glutamyl-phosphate reductase [Actinorhabdospora filicis]|uniref:N-acetyl-gamma-glutamyl-phosphate reductase n=1 Tax=Actinorhabdospora filicis TaxID=1785913 RepID=A0A9W6SFT1_9ACTN|nr:N-acetyl-gamma-glutamyl-phosphate reductase [Actinorhabdospora filicis]GLZ75223.1 N-acetyl-gamma-glutamyl-phosphate reductase [Actinorhabdospora filicis]
MGTRVAIAGASGYAGGELLRLLVAHPEFELGAVTAHSQAGAPVTSVHPHLATLAGRNFDAATPAALGDADLVFLALPHGESAAVAASLPAHVKVVDLGADHRLTDAAAWTAYYGGEHAGAWTYGLPELPGQREKIAAATHVAATGCYVVASTLALRPLIDAGLADPADVVIVAASGTSGAGRTAKAHLMGSEVMGDVSAYKVGAHQHTPEIKQATGATSLCFTPVLAPLPRGILSTVTARPLRPGLSSDEVRQALQAAYADEPFVHVLPEGRWPRTASTFGTNSAHLQATVDLDAGRITAVAAIDNLGKGAAGQAVQCANLMLGLPETTGLAINGVAP